MNCSAPESRARAMENTSQPASRDCRVQWRGLIPLCLSHIIIATSSTREHDTIETSVTQAMESSPASSALTSQEPDMSADNIMANNFTRDYLSSSPVRGEIGKSTNNFDGMEIGAKEEGRESSSPNSCSPCPNEDDQRFSAVWTNGQLTKATGRKEGDSGFISPAGATNNGHVGMESVNPFNEVNFHQGLGKTSSNDFECSKTPSLGTEPDDKVLDSSLESENDHHYSYDNNQEDQEQEVSTNGFNNYNIYNQDLDTKFDQTDNFLVPESEKIAIKGDIRDLKPVSNNFEDIQNYNNLDNKQNGINNENFSFEENDNKKKQETPMDFDSKESSPEPIGEEHAPANNGVKDNQLLSNLSLNDKQSELETDLDMVKSPPESSPNLNIDKVTVDDTEFISEMSTVPSELVMEAMMTNSSNIDTLLNDDEEKLIEEPEKEEPGYHYKLSEEDGCIGITSDPMTTSMFQMKDTEEDCPEKEVTSSDEEDHSEKKDEEKDYSSSASEAEEEQPYETLNEDVDKNCSKTEDLVNVTSGCQMNTMDVHTVNKSEETASSDFVHLDKEEHNIEFEMQGQQYGEEPIEQDYNNLTNDTKMDYQMVEGTQNGLGDDHNAMQNDQVLLEEKPESTPTFDDELDEIAVNTQNGDHNEESYSEKIEMQVNDDLYPEKMENSHQFRESREDLEEAGDKTSIISEDISLQNKAAVEANSQTTESEMMDVVDNQKDEKSPSDSDSDSSGDEADDPVPAKASTEPQVEELEDAVKENVKFEEEPEEITTEGPVAEEDTCKLEQFEDYEDKVMEIKEFKEEKENTNIAPEEKEHDQLEEASQNESLLVSKETGVEEKIELLESPQLEEKDFEEDEQMKMQNYNHTDNQVPMEATKEEKSIESFNSQNVILNEPVESQNFEFTQEETGRQENMKDDFDIQKPLAPVEEKFDGSEDDFSVEQASVDPVINICAEVPHATEVQNYQELDNNVVEEFVQEETSASLQSTAFDTMEMQAKNQEFEAMVGESMIKTQEVEAQASNSSQLTKTQADNLSEVTSPTVLEKAFDDYQEMKKEVPMPVFDDTKMQEPAYEIAKEPKSEAEKEKVSATFIEAVQSELHEPIYACQKDEPKAETVEEERKEDFVTELDANETPAEEPRVDIKKEELIQETLLEKEETVIKTMNQELDNENVDVQIEAKEETAEHEIIDIEPTQTPQQEKEIVEKVELGAVNTPADATSIETTNDYQTPSNDSVTNDQSRDDPKPLVDETTVAQPDIKPDEKVSADDVAKAAKSAAKSVASAVKKSPKPPTTLALTKTTPKAAGKSGSAPPATRAATRPRAVPSTTKAPATTKAAPTTGPKTTTRPTSASLASAKPLTSGAARPSTRPATTRPATAPTSKAPIPRPQTSRPATTSTRTARSTTQTARPETKTTSSTSTTPTPKPAGVARMKITPRTTSTSRLREASAARVKAERATTPASKPQTPTARTPLSSRTTPTTKAPPKRTPTKPTSASASSKELANTPFAKRQARLRAKSTEKKAPAEKKENTEENGTAE